MLILALLSTTAATVYAVYAYFGYLWKRTKTESWLFTMSSTEGYTDYALTMAKVYRGIIQHPRRHLIISVVSSVLSVLLWILLAFQTLND